MAAEQPLGQVEVIEMLTAHSAVVVRVVTTRGVEVIDADRNVGRRARFKMWMGRPPQVFVIGAVLAALSAWMVAAAESSDRQPAWFIRGVGVVGVVFFGVGTIVAFVRWRRTGGER